MTIYVVLFKNCISYTPYVTYIYIGMSSISLVSKLNPQATFIPFAISHHLSILQIWYTMCQSSFDKCITHKPMCFGTRCIGKCATLQYLICMFIIGVECMCCWLQSCRQITFILLLSFRKGYIRWRWWRRHTHTVYV